MKKVWVLVVLVLLSGCNNPDGPHNSHFIDNNDYGFIYHVIDREVEIVRVIESKKNTMKKLIVPSKIDNYPVKSIASNAFIDCVIEEVLFDEECLLESIGKSAFSDCKKLKYIEIPKSVKVIGEDAFYNCEAMESLVFSSSSNLEMIGSNAFVGNVSLGYIDFPQKLKLIGDECFLDCESLIEVNFFSQIETIGYMAFSNAIHLEINFMELETIPDTFVHDWNLSSNLCDNGTYYIGYNFK